MSSVTDDPIRSEVERVLRSIVDCTVVAPIAAFTAVPRCLARRCAAVHRRLGEPARVVRSLFELVATGGVRGIVTPDDAPTPGAPAVARIMPDGVAADLPSVEHLPIDEYESLAASQVVARLPTLTTTDLEVVRTFEAAHRGRRTILGRIDQLLA
jgi:hypothetical protein